MGNQLLDLAVWAPDSTAVPEPVAPHVHAMRQRGIQMAAYSTAEVSRTAKTAVAAATELADVIENIRHTTVRGPHGAIDATALDRYTHAHRSLTEAIDQVTAATVATCTSPAGTSRPTDRTR